MTLPEGKALRVAWGETVAELGKTDPRIVVLDGDLGSSTRADIFEAAHPDRFFQMGIAEQNMLGVAAGMATVGFIPFVSTFACFAVARALDSIRVLIAQPKLPVKITGSLCRAARRDDRQDPPDVRRRGDHAGHGQHGHRLPGRRGRDRQGDQGDRRLRRSRLPAAHPAEHADPVRRLATEFELGKAVTVREGGDATVFSTGVHTTRVYEAAEVLAADGIEIKLVHVPTIKPLDEEAIVEAAKETGFVITAEEHTIIGGLGGAVAETLSDKYPVPVKRTGLGRRLRRVGPQRRTAGEVRDLGRARSPSRSGRSSQNARNPHPAYRP